MTGFSPRPNVVIVGSGPTGAAFARTIADEWPEVRICMIESGPIVSDPPGHHVANISDPAAQVTARLASQGPASGIVHLPTTESEWLERIAGRPDASMLRRPGLFAVGGGDINGHGFPAGHASSNVGGMGAHWFGGCPRPAPSERADFLKAEIFEAALDRAETLLKSSSDQYLDSPIAPVLEARLGALFDSGRPAARRVQPMPMAVVRDGDRVSRSGTDVILGDLLGSDPDRFELRPNTVCRRVIVENGHATGVEVCDTLTNQVSIIEASTVVIAADALHTPQLLFASGIRPPALGRYLNEHLQVGLMAELDGVELSDQLNGVTWVPYLGETFPFSITITQAAPEMLPFGAPGANPRKPWLFISLFAAADLQFDNCVAFHERTLDWRGLPSIECSFRPSATDLARVEWGKRIVGEIAAAVGRPLPGFGPMIPPYGSSLHYQGTVRMGAIDDGLSVCDENSQVWGFDNLFVAGNGVIPTMTGTNPTLTSVALAVLAGQHVASQRHS